MKFLLFHVYSNQWIPVIFTDSVCFFFTFNRLYQTLRDPTIAIQGLHQQSPPQIPWISAASYLEQRYHICRIPLFCYKFSQIFVTLCLSKVPLFAANKLWRKHLRRSLSISWRSTTSSTCEAVPAWVWALRMRPNDLMSTKSKQF